MTFELSDPSDESCEGRCAGTADNRYGCISWAQDGKTTYQCDPNGGGGCKYIDDDDEVESSSWCTYMTFGPASTTQNGTPVAPEEACEGRCAGTVENNHGCISWAQHGKTTYQCDPNGGGGCKYINNEEAETSSWCTYMTFEPPSTINSQQDPPSQREEDTPEESCDGRCAGTAGNHYGCISHAIEGKTIYQCDPNGAGGCKYITDEEVEASSWCTYMTLSEPDQEPTNRPTGRPTSKPTNEPTNRPTDKPTNKPTNRPTDKPTKPPTKPPTREPTKQPTREPTREPTNTPTKEPTRKPTTFLEGFASQPGAVYASVNGQNGPQTASATGAPR